MMKRVEMLKNMAFNDGNVYRKYLATSTVSAIKDKLVKKEMEATEEAEKKAFVTRIDQLKRVIEEIISNEDDQSLKARYKSFQ